MAVKRVSRGQRQARRVRISITANYQLFCDYQQTFLKMIEMDNKQIIYILLFLKCTGMQMWKKNVDFSKNTFLPRKKVPLEINLKLFISA